MYKCVLLAICGVLTFISSSLHGMFCLVRFRRFRMKDRFMTFVMIFVWELDLKMSDYIIIMGT